MTVYLVAAEIGGIQDLVFRSSRLREVVGASQLLSRFCRVQARASLSPAERVFIGDGGAFRVVFDRLERAEAFCSELPALFGRELGGELAVASPVPFEEGDEAEENRAIRLSQGLLRQLKLQGAAPAAVAHGPYTAFCESCGLEPATDHRTLFEDQGPRYVCDACTSKAEERWQQRESFLGTFEAEVVSRMGGAASRLMSPRDAEAVGSLDARRNVAYLVADANGMGRWFDRCNLDRMKSLSNELRRVLLESLAAPCRDLSARISEASDRWPADRQPVLPLVLAGDDCFALVPAPWALDFARRFCATFEREMTTVGRTIGLLGEGEIASISAAVVVCKSSYPHRLAHERGERLLRSAKRASRLGAPERASRVSFEVVSGNSVDVRTGYGVAEVRPSVQPMSLELLGRLLEQRCRLRDLPSKRVSELRALYDDLPDRYSELAGKWQLRLDRLLSRVGDPSRRKLIGALRDLGDASDSQGSGYWSSRRDPRTHDVYYANGLADLVRSWRYAHRLSGPSERVEEAKA